MRGIILVIGGVAHTIPEWSEISGVSENIIKYRFDRGFSGKALIAPTKQMLRQKQMIHEIWKGGNFQWTGN